MHLTGWRNMLTELCQGLPWYGAILTVTLIWCKAFCQTLFAAFTSFTQRQDVEELSYATLHVLHPWKRF